jgi:hypothetical protein
MVPFGKLRLKLRDDLAERRISLPLLWCSMRACCIWAPTILARR